MCAEERYVRAGNINTRYVTAGEGSPLILVHGILSSVDCWQNNIEPLSSQHSVYALDLPGHGLSDRIKKRKRLVLRWRDTSDTPKFEYSLLQTSQFLGLFLDALNLDRVDLIGHCSSGLVTLTFAYCFPERVDRLVLVAPVGIEKNLGLPLGFFALPVLGDMLAVTSRGMAKLFLRRLSPNPRSLNKEPLGLRQRLITLEKLCLTTVPTLIVWGTQDRYTPVAHAHVARRLIAGSRLHLFPGCDHWPHLEKPAEFNDLVLDFLGDR